MLKIRQKNLKFLKKELILVHPYGKISLSFSKNNRLRLFISTNGSLTFFINADENTRESWQYTLPNKDFERQGSSMVNIVEAAKFVVQLYYITGQKYHCSLTKVEKILAIADLIIMRSGNKLFSNEIISHDCGVGFPILSDYLYSNIIEGNPEQKNFIDDDFDNTIEIPRLYAIENPEAIPEYLKELIIEVFREFGDYTARDLGLYMNAFKDKILSDQTINGERFIDPMKVQGYFENIDGTVWGSDVYNFIYTHSMVIYEL